MLVVLVLGPPAGLPELTEDDLAGHLRDRMETTSLKEAVAEVT